MTAGGCSRVSRWGNWYWLRRELKRAILHFVGSEKELEMEAFRMASVGMLTEDEGLQRILLGILCKWLEAQDMGEKDLNGSRRANRYGCVCYGDC